MSDRDGALFQVWARSYERLWGGLKHALLPHKQGVYRILLGPGRGLRIRVNPAHGGVRVLLGRYEPPLMGWLMKAIKPGATFYDVGSNDGHVALIAALLTGEYGVVYAFERDEEVRKCLYRNLDLNPDVASRVMVMPYEVGRIDDMAAGKVSIDGLCLRGIRPPDAIKIDVEGAESDVLAGMTHLGTDGCQSAFIECHTADLETQVRRFFECRNRRVKKAAPSLLEVSRHGYNTWLYTVDVGN